MLEEGTVAVITGAGRGIGRQIALAFAEAGADLVLAARTERELDQTSAAVGELGRQSLVVRTDISQPDSVQSLADGALDQYGRVDVLVNNAGIGGPSAPLWEIDPSDWDTTLAINVTGTYLCCRAFLPSMIERGSGSIIIIGSMTGKRPLWGRTPYSASKLAVVGLARTLALEVGAHGIRVNVISPGTVEGDRIEWVFRKQAEGRGVSVDKVRQELTDATALKRLIPADDVAATAVFLASSMAGSITGEDINVSAGLVMY